MKKLKIFISLMVLVVVKSFSQDSLEVLNYYNTHYKTREERHKEWGGDIHFRDSCLRGTELAMADYKAGILRTGGFGYPSHKMMQEDYQIKLDAFKKILKDEFNIIHQNYGCVIGTSKDCYSYFMNEKIKEKYGDSIYYKVWRKVDSIWENGTLDRPALFPYGYDVLNDLIYCNLKLIENNNAKEKTDRTFTVTIDFNKNGEVERYSIKEDKIPGKIINETFDTLLDIFKNRMIFWG